MSPDTDSMGTLARWIVGGALAVILLGVACKTHGETYVVTAYTAGYESCGKAKSDPAYGITASGKRVAPGMCAAPASIPFGTRLRVQGQGVLVVEDRGGAIKGNRLDIYMPSLKAARQFGRRWLTVRIFK